MRPIFHPFCSYQSLVILRIIVFSYVSKYNIETWILTSKTRCVFATIHVPCEVFFELWSCTTAHFFEFFSFPCTLKLEHLGSICSMFRYLRPTQSCFVYLARPVIYSLRGEVTVLLISSHCLCFSCSFVLGALCESFWNTYRHLHRT